MALLPLEEGEGGEEGHLPGDPGSLPYVLFQFILEVFNSLWKSFTSSASKPLDRTVAVVVGAGLLGENPLSTHSMCSNPKCSSA